MIRAAELLLERGYGKAPVFHTSDPEQFRDVLEMTDAEIRDRLAVLRGMLLEHGIDPLGCQPREATGSISNSAKGGRPTPGWLAALPSQSTGAGVAVLIFGRFEIRERECEERC